MAWRDARLPLAALIFGCAVLASGCKDRPRAPVLRDDPVFQNDQAGFRFLAPEGWTLSARSVIPSGKVAKELTLVDYRRTTGHGASFLVTLADLDPSTDLNAHLAGPTFGVSKWTPTGPPVEVKVGSAEGLRHGFTARTGKEDRAKEVVSVRRGERVFFFVTLYRPSDHQARDQARRAVDSVIWKN